MDEVAKAPLAIGRAGQGDQEKAGKKETKPPEKNITFVTNVNVINLWWSIVYVLVSAGLGFSQCLP